MLKTEQQTEQEAIGWVIRLRHASAADWEAFTDWLEADPAHLVAYEGAALADEAADGLADSPLPAPQPAWVPAEEERPHRTGRRAFLGWGIAASLALAAGWSAFGGGAGPYAVETAAGERRTVDLADGSRIELNGGTRIMLDEDRPRFARLEQGEALFRIVHDERRPFEVEAGGALLRDMGTVFNVTQDEAGLEVAVAEGAVLFDPHREARDLRPGMALRRSEGGRLWVGATDAAAVGAWREGRLVYAGAPATRVAADLSRNLGVPVAARGPAATRPFSGVILLEGEPREVLERSAALLGLTLSRSASGWTLTTGAGAAR